jgi:toxin ParE1/3/4
VARLLVTGAADSDAAAIIGDLADKAGARVAARYDAEFDRLYRRLESFPTSGSPRPALGAGVRIGVVPPFIVIYEYFEADDTVTILRLVHGRREVTRRLLKTPSSRRGGASATGAPSPR